jgi:octaprenyl-diphosphate synthase
VQRSAPTQSAKGSERLDSIYGPILAELAEMELLLERELQSSSTAIQRLVAHVGHYRGKRLRPALVLLTGRIGGGLVPAHVNVAAIIELIHTATLVHDDVLDDAEQRRGVRSLNRAAGNEVSVLLGDLIYAKAFAMSTALDDQTASRVLAQVTQTICSGEIEQVSARDDLELTDQRYFQIIRDKTAVLYAAAGQLGAWYAGASPEVVAALESYGLNLGIAFQVIDDCLDLTGEEAVVGKSLGTDIEKGKMTLPLIHLASTLPAAERESLFAMLRNAEIADRRAHLWSRHDMGGAIAFAQQSADEHVRASLNALKNLPASPSLQSLRLIAKYVLERDR